MSFSIPNVLPAFPYPQLPAASPRACGLLSLLQSGTAFDRTLINSASALQSRIYSIASTIENLPNIIEGIAYSQLMALAQGLQAVAAGAVQNLINHATSQIAYLINNLNLATAALGTHLGLNTRGCGLSSMPGATYPDPCANMNDFFGSIMGLGMGLVEGISDALDTVTSGIQTIMSGVFGALDSVLNTMYGALNAINGIASQITNMIVGETAALARALTDMIGFGAASALESLFGNPCARTVLQQVGTPELVSQLNIPET
jgi:phage-related protein